MQLVLPQMVMFRRDGVVHGPVQMMEQDPETGAIRVAWPDTVPDRRQIQKTRVEAGDYWPAP